MDTACRLYVVSCGVARYLHRDWRMIPGVFDPS